MEHHTKAIYRCLVGRPEIAVFGWTLTSELQPDVQRYGQRTLTSTHPLGRMFEKRSLAGLLSTKINRSAECQFSPQDGYFDTSRRTIFFFLPRVRFV